MYAARDAWVGSAAFRALGRTSGVDVQSLRDAVQSPELELDEMDDRAARRKTAKVRLKKLSDMDVAARTAQTSAEIADLKATIKATRPKQLYFFPLPET